MQPNMHNPNLNCRPNDQSIMNPRMEAGGRRSLTPIETEDPNIVGISLADPAIRTERQYDSGVCARWIREAMNTPSGTDGDIISWENVLKFYPPKRTLIAAPKVIREVEKRMAAEAEAATGIKRPQQQDIWFSDETMVVGDPDPPPKLDYNQLRALGLPTEPDQLAAARVVDGPRPTILFETKPTIYTPQREFIDLVMKRMCCKACVAAAEALATCECSAITNKVDFGGSGLQRPRNDSNHGTTDLSTTASGIEVQVEDVPVLKRPYKDPHVATSSGDN